MKGWLLDIKVWLNSKGNCMWEALQVQVWILDNNYVNLFFIDHNKKEITQLVQMIKYNNKTTKKVVDHTKIQYGKLQKTSLASNSFHRSIKATRELHMIKHPWVKLTLVATIDYWWEKFVRWWDLGWVFALGNMNTLFQF